MPCAHPIPAARPVAGGRPVLSGVRELRDLGSRADEVLRQSGLLFLPCGSCVGCQLSRARSWAIRCSLEVLEHECTSFLTLTFSDRYLPPSLSREDVSVFMRRLRKATGRAFRFFACGEYGDWFGRPHYHALLFGPVDPEEVERAWRKGFATVAPVNPARISYVAGYCAKKVGLFDQAEERVDYATGEVHRYQPPFVQMSRRPGIGGAARRHWRSWRESAVWSERQVPVPRFLHSSWKENASESEVARLEMEKREREMTLTVRELDASEAIARKRVSLKSEGRSL